MRRMVSLLILAVTLCISNSISDVLTADENQLVPDDCFDVCTSQSDCFQGWDAGAELLIVRPYISLDHGVYWNESYDEGDTEYSNVSAPQYGYEASPRIWLGYTGCHGFGLRTRWWSLDQESEVLKTNPDEHEFDEIGTTFSTLALDVIDMEMTFRDHFCQWNLLSSAGLRYARIDFFSSDREEAEWGDDLYLETTKFESYGPTVAIEARRQFCCGLTPYVIARGSLLAGNHNFVRDHKDYDENQEDDYDTRRFAEITHTIELQIGAELCRETPYGDLVMGVALEGQFWNRVGAMFDSSSDQEEDHMHMFVAGGVLTFGIRR